MLDDRDREIVGRLQIEPEFGCRSEIPCETDRGIGRHGARLSPAFTRVTQNFSDAGSGDPKRKRERISDCSAGGRTAFEKVGRKLRLPDDFCQSQTEIDNFRPALTKVVRQFEKLAGIPKSRTEIEISSRKPKIPDGNSQSQTAFGKVSRLWKKSDDF